MYRYLLGRLIQTIASILAIITIVFLLTRLSGDPAAVLVSPEAGKEAYQQMRISLGLDKPIYIQFGIFMKDVLQGNFGKSWNFQRPALTLVLERFPATAQLAFAALAISILVGIPLGVFSAMHRDSWFDSMARVVGLLGQSMPGFWLGIMLILLLSVNLHFLPTSGRGDLSQLIMPALTMGFFPIAAIMRLTRSSMLDVLDREYIKMARIKGVPEWLVICKHGFKNAAIPVLTMLGLQLGAFLGGAVVTETVFAWPGVGRLAVQSVFARDFPTVQAAVFVTSVAFLLINLTVDIVYAFLNPRIRYA